MKKANIILQILPKILKNAKPFRFLYSNRSRMFIIGIRFDRFQKYDCFGWYKSLVFYLGYRYRCFEWVDVI